jgi:hypothetical protein
MVSSVRPATLCAICLGADCADESTTASTPGRRPAINVAMSVTFGSMKAISVQFVSGSGALAYRAFALVRETLLVLREFLVPAMVLLLILGGNQIPYHPVKKM